MNDFHPKPFGKYFLIDKLATGGMAEIYKAKTFGVDGFEKQLAIKRILPHCSADKEFIGMLIDEAKLSVLLSHTNIVQVYDLGKVGDDYFISMEFINGSNLREVLNRAKELDEKFSEDIVVYIISEVCKGLDYAHAKKDSDGNPLNIVHRDISPQNILLSFEGEVKIVDFGIAKAAMNISHTMAGILKGKISYMSPEQALGKPIDRKTDIFSTGLMLYELLTGDKLFTGETQFEVLKKIRTTRLTEKSFPESIPLPIRKILAKALAYSNKDRYESGGDFQIDLTRYLYSTYVDFTPRKLSKLMVKLFAEEIENKRVKKKEDVSIDAKTRSVMIGKAEQENIVHRETTEHTSTAMAAVAKQPTQTFIEAFISGQEPASAGIPEITRTRHDLKEEEATPTPIPEPAAAIPKAPKPRAHPPKKRQWGRYVVSSLSLLLLVGVGLFTYYKTNLFKPAPPPITSSLQISSNPEGAQIFLNDQPTQLVTPANIDKLKVGEAQRITLKKEKFKDFTKTITLPDANPVSLNPTLEVIPVGMIKVTTTPPGAMIFLNGKDTGKISPANLEDLPLSETYSLRLELNKHHPVEERVTVYSIEPINFNKKMEEIQYGSIQIATIPKGSHIYLDNADSGLNTPATINNLEVGKSYNLRLTHEGYREVTRSVPLAEPKVLALNETLQKIEEKTPEQLAQEKAKAEADKLKQQEAQKQLEAQKQQEAEKQAQQAQKQTPLQKQQEADKLKAQEAQKQQEAKKQQEAEKQTQQTQKEKQAQLDKQKEAEKETPKETSGTGDGYVSVSSDPKGADVFINGVRKGSSPGKFKVATGTPVEVTISKSGLSTVTKVVTLRPGETRSLGTINLGGGGESEAAGIVMVDSNPPGAMVFLDGAPQKSTPLRIRGLRPQTTHTITVKKDGFKTWSTSFTVGDGKNSFMANLKND
jgi:eukaryotic-like serine/threonine-protein kinase